MENRLSDLWALFDFLNPGLLGSRTVFQSFVKSLQAREENPFAPLRRLVGPYILRRLKTDRAIVGDLPAKTETARYCHLTRAQVKLYGQVVRTMQREMESAVGIARRGVVLRSLLRLKQVCNHPSQLLGDAEYRPADSGKFLRLAEICEELAERQEKVLVFTQFREIIGPLAEHLSAILGGRGWYCTARPGSRNCAHGDATASLRLTTQPLRLAPRVAMLASPPSPNRISSTAKYPHSDRQRTRQQSHQYSHNMQIGRCSTCSLSRSHSSLYVENTSTLSIFTIFIFANASHLVLLQFQVLILCNIRFNQLFIFRQPVFHGIRSLSRAAPCGTKTHDSVANSILFTASVKYSTNPIYVLLYPSFILDFNRNLR